MKSHGTILSIQWALVSWREVARFGAAGGMQVSTSAARSVSQFGRPRRAEMGVAAQQGEVSHIQLGRLTVSYPKAPRTGR